MQLMINLISLGFILFLVILFSYCHCDNDHGGFDCSVEIVSRQGMLCSMKVFKSLKKLC